MGPVFARLVPTIESLSTSGLLQQSFQCGATIALIGHFRYRFVVQWAAFRAWHPRWKY